VKQLDSEEAGRVAAEEAGRSEEYRKELAEDEVGMGRERRKQQLLAEVADKDTKATRTKAREMSTREHVGSTNRVGRVSR
jgi:hypothetical protein